MCDIRGPQSKGGAAVTAIACRPREGNPAQIKSDILEETPCIENGVSETLASQLSTQDFDMGKQRLG